LDRAPGTIRRCNARGEVLDGSARTAPGRAAPVRFKKGESLSEILDVVIRYTDGSERIFRSERALLHYLYLKRHGEKKFMQLVKNEAHAAIRRQKGQRISVKVHRAAGEPTRKAVLASMARLKLEGVPERKRRSKAAEENNVTSARVG